MNATIPSTRPVSRIVVGVDFSRACKGAFEAAMNLAEDLEASLTLVHAEPARTFIGGGMGEYAPDPGLHAEALADDAVTLSTEWAARARKRGIEVQTVVRPDIPFKVIREVADEVDAVLIVVGTHGRSGASRLVLGSVAETVVRHSNRPVLVVPAALAPRRRKTDRRITA